MNAAGHGPASATRCVTTAYDDLAAVLQLSQCRCDGDAQSDLVVLRATLSGLHASLIDFLGNHLADPRAPGNPGPVALDRLVRAHAQLLRVDGHRRLTDRTALVDRSRHCSGGTMYTVLIPLAVASLAVLVVALPTLVVVEILHAVTRRRRVKARSRSSH
ncbi:MAG: hypothetical protein F2801_08955 [Actinobacteria bacterium]|nr:hypothetical protein [Actinomycetota bacterium]